MVLIKPIFWLFCTAGWATLVLSLLSAVALISISIAILSGHRRQAEAEAAVQAQGHNYRPVSILQRIPANGEGIALQTLTNSNLPPAPPQRQIRVHRNAPAHKQQTSNGSHTVVSSGERHRRHEERRKQTERQRLSSGSSRTQGRSSAESPRMESKKQRQHHHPEIPPSGLIKSLSGSFKQYLWASTFYLSMIEKWSQMFQFPSDREQKRACHTFSLVFIRLNIGYYTILIYVQYSITTYKILTQNITSNTTETNLFMRTYPPSTGAIVNANWERTELH